MVTLLASVFPFAACSETRATVIQTIDLGRIPPTYETRVRASVAGPPHRSVLARVVSSCGCVDAELVLAGSVCKLGTSVPANSVLQLRATYSRKSAVGHRRQVRETVRCVFRDPGRPAPWNTEVRIRGTVDPTLSLVTRIERPDRIDMAATDRASIVVFLRRPVALDAVAVAPVGKGLTAAVVRPGTEAPAKQVDRIAVDCRIATPGDHVLQVRIPLEEDRYEWVSVEVRAAVDASLRPARLIMRLHTGQNTTKRIEIGGTLFEAADLVATAQPTYPKPPAITGGFRISAEGELRPAASGARVLRVSIEPGTAAGL